MFSDHKNSTPIRTVRPIKPSRSYSPPSPSTSSELDDSLCADLAELELSPSTLKQLKVEFAAQTRIPGYLRPLLQECGQSTPCEFSAFIEMFPFDSIVYTSRNGANAWTPGFTSQDIASFQKIGEASYSEVYGIGDIVLKIIPLRDEEARYVQDDGIDTPAPSDSKDVLREIIVTRAMGEAHGGFVKLLRSYVVRGKYPSLLLDLWDKFHKLKGSESVRPGMISSKIRVIQELILLHATLDSFNVSQLYAIIALPNGGPDLEAFKFSAATKTGWKQACSLFWQVTRALAEAEDLVRFEVCL